MRKLTRTLHVSPWRNTEKACSGLELRLNWADPGPICGLKCRQRRRLPGPLRRNPTVGAVKSWRGE